MGKPDAITRRTGDEKAGLEEKLFSKGQLDLSPNVNKGQQDPNANKGQLDPNVNEGQKDSNVDPRMLENLIR